MADAVFAFGQRGGYHFECPSKWHFGLLPEKIQELFKTKQIASVYCLSLGAADSFFISYSAKDGKDHIYSDGIPVKLKEFLFEKDATGVCIRKFPTLQVTLGPYNKSYWAEDGTSFRWNNLPSTLHTHLKGLQTSSGNWTDTPRIVALGANDNFVLVTEGNGGLWTLPHYRELDSVLDSLRDMKGGRSGFSLIHRLVLNPYRLQCGILQAQNGTTLGMGLPPHAQEAFQSIEESIREDTLAKVRREYEDAQKLREVETTLARLRVMQQQQQVMNTMSMTALLGMMQGFNLSNNS